MPLSVTPYAWIQSLPPGATAQLPPVSQASFGVGDTLFLVVIALIVFGPKKLPEISRQIGKLVFEFRKASNDFKFQIEEELRASEQSERMKQLETQAATPQPAAPVAMTADETVSAVPAESVTDTPATAETTPTILPPASGLPVSSERPYGAPVAPDRSAEAGIVGNSVHSAPSPAENLDELQANAQDAVRAAAADPSYKSYPQAEGNGAASEESARDGQPGDAIATHHG